MAFGGTWAGKDESPHSTDEPLELTVGGRVVPLRGRIDRLEWEPGGTFRIIDYKTGKNRSKGVFDGGRALQLALYLLAAAKIVEIDVTQGHRVVRVPDAAGRVRFACPARAATLAGQQDDLDVVLGRIVGGIASGDFHPEPGERLPLLRLPRPSATCAATRSPKRKASDDRRVSFAEMQEIE